MSNLDKEINHAIKHRKPPFQVSYHGDSTIINDADGLWCVGQVDRDTAEQLAISMTAAAVAEQR